MSDFPICEAFAEIALLADALGVRRINELEGCWEYQVDEQWRFALNGHNTPHDTDDGVRVPPFSAFVEFNGWPAGIIDPAGGVLAAGDAANESTFIAALQAARAALSPKCDGKA